MKTETLREWIEKDHGSRITVVDPEASKPENYWLIIHYDRDGKRTSYAYDYVMLQLIEDVNGDLWRTTVAEMICDARDEMRRLNGEGGLVA